MTQTTTDTGTDSAEPNPYRLPRTVVPVRYDLTIEPDLADASFTGACAAVIDVQEATSTIVLNAIELEVRNVRLLDETGTEIAADAVVLDETTERLTIETAAPVAPGRWVLHTEFAGVLNDKLRGFYRSTFTDTDGVEQVIAVTQFESTHARRAFPCWDEPDLKAVFGLTLVVDPELTALSNTSELSRSRIDDGRDVDVVRFADTMVMSTYLLAFVIGPLDVTEPVEANGKPLRVAYPKGKGHLTAFALEVGKFSLEFFADYYDIDYPGDKLDLVAIPDFAFGAMENLGCVTFREVLVLVDPDRATQPELSRIADVICHELAHMWFGDLVTMKWWNGIWLNEAFATFMEMLCADAFRPEWQRWTSFGLSRTAAFDVDALKTTRPIEFPVVSPDDAEGMFDILTYEKGAAVVRMLEQYLGAEPFRDGIRAYLRAHSYGNTETTDLWDALEETTGEPVRRIMDSWIFQGGFPVIDVELLRDEIDPSVPHTVRFTQRRFGYAGDIGEGDPAVDAELARERWIVPIIFTLKDEPGAITVEKGLIDDKGLEVPTFNQLQWVLANTEGTGFYRARYDTDLLAGIMADAHQDLSPIERYGIVDDSWASVLAGDRSTVDFMALARMFTPETDLSVWERVVGALGGIDRLVHGDAREGFRAYIREVVEPALERMGPDPRDGDSDRDRELRGTLLRALGVLGDDSATKIRARDLYEASTRDPAGVDPALVSAAVSIISSSGGPAEFEQFVERMRRAETPQDELRFLSALADFDDAALIDRVLAMSLTDEVRTQNAPYLLRRCLVNRDHGARAWFFIADNWEPINQRFPSPSIVRMLEGVRALSTPDLADRVFTFFGEHDVPQGEKTLAQHLESLEVHVALRQREEPLLASHLT